MELSSKKIIIEVDKNDLIEQDKRENVIRVVHFSLGEENYCVDIFQIKEVILFGDVTKVPLAPDFVIGVISLRGEIIPLFDIRSFFGLKDSQDQKYARVIVTEIDGCLLGILVDRIIGTIEIEQSSIQPPLSTIESTLVEYTKGQIQLNHIILIFLDLEKILRCQKMENLKKGDRK